MSAHLVSRSRFAHVRTRGFTLIEVLVVVSIIALLISILLPSLRRARDESKFVVCQSGFRQLGMGCSYFAGDHKGYYPDPQRWLTWTPWYWGTRDPIEFTAPKANANTGRQESLILRYVKTPEAYLCVSDKGDRLWKDAPNDWGAQPAGRTSFAMNAVLQSLVSGRHAGLSLPPPLSGTYPDRDPMAHVWYKDDILLDRSDRIMLMLEESELSPCNDGSVDWEGYWQTGFKEQTDKVSVRHNGRGNMLMFDGHVEGIRAEKDFNQATKRASQKSGRWYGALYPERNMYKIRTRAFKQPSKDKTHGTIQG
jgi:prepilin-type processing-associated H-X9-DG protein/prepilin-type N-terminal cleavage/methylation domain-containing protein